MKVRKVLEHLSKDTVKRLCRCRDLSQVGNKNELITRLARSYHGDHSVVVSDLRKKDMVEVLRAISMSSDRGELPPRWQALPISKLREICLAVLEGRHITLSRSAGVETEDRWSFDIALFAIGCSGMKGVETLKENSLVEMAANADSVTILSAYYVPEVLENIVGTCRGDVKIVLNGLV